MKKFKNILLAASLVLASSCSMDYRPVGSLDDETAILSLEDAEKSANYLMVRLRGLYSGSYIYSSELSTDLFHPTLAYGNRGGNMYRWEFDSQTGEMESLWSHAYFTIANANYLIKKIGDLDKSGMSGAETARLDQILGEAAFIKAVNVYALVEKFCNPYNEASASGDLGVMIVDEYAPTSDQSKYPGRSSLKDTFTYIEEQIKIAESKVTAAGVVSSENITIDAVTALKARVALAKGDYATAAAAAASLVDGGKYPLIDAASANAKEEWENLWHYDSGKECIMQLYANFADQSVPSTLTYGYYGLNTSGVYAPDYVPESHIIESYTDSDIRTNWFETVTITVSSINGAVTLLNKFPGNPALQSPTQGTSSYLQKIKPFRIAEQYLIAAEAYAKMGAEDKAAQYLSAFATKRDPIFEVRGDLLTLIKNERLKELIGEGFRFYDLKRYGQGFSRSEAQNASVTTSNGLNFELSAGNYRWQWPIPQAEIDSNPQIKDQQNPGYTK